ncbi:hypothetical protein M9Y10_039727 [Tritrichomonas musculus]|uniref:Uncharacterized protein n=1 Tax=Tritrichomonas musculus TaxID=1915356 RepID=A0ABR2GR18_9EUKA
MQETLKTIDNIITELFTLKTQLCKNHLQNVIYVNSLKKQTTSNTEEESLSEPQALLEPCNCEPQISSDLECDTQIEPLSGSKIEPLSGSQLEASIRPKHRRIHRSFPLNRSKFLSDEQREKVLEFANTNKDLILNQPLSDRMKFLKKIVHEQLKTNLSEYMACKIINILSQND